MKGFSEKLKILDEKRDVYIVQYKDKKLRIWKDSNFRPAGDGFMRVHRDTLARQFEQAIRHQKQKAESLKSFGNLNFTETLMNMKKAAAEPAPAPDPGIKKLKPLMVEETERAFELMEENHKLFDPALIDKISKAIAAGKQKDDFYRIIETEDAIKQEEIRRVIQENTPPLTDEQKTARIKNRPRGPEMKRGFEKGLNMTVREMIYQDRKNAAAVRKREALERAADNPWEAGANANKKSFREKRLRD